MSATTFDTIKYFDELITAGVPEAQAKAQVNVLKRVVTAISDSKLVSKVDLKDLELKIEKCFVTLEKCFAALENRFVRLEVLMVITLAVLLLPTLKSLF